MVHGDVHGRSKSNDRPDGLASPGLLSRRKEPAMLPTVCAAGSHPGSRSLCPSFWAWACGTARASAFSQTGTHEKKILFSTTLKVAKHCPEHTKTKEDLSSEAQIRKWSLLEKNFPN